MTDDKGFVYRTLEAVDEHIFTAIILGGGLMLGGILVFGAYAKHLNTEVQKAKIQAGLELKVGDYNGNNILDKFYEIEGKKVPVEVDGRDVETYF